jgi:hypothetical protein
MMFVMSLNDEHHKQFSLSGLSEIAYGRLVDIR